MYIVFSLLVSVYVIIVNFEYFEYCFFDFVCRFEMLVLLFMVFFFMVMYEKLLKNI